MKAARRPKLYPHLSAFWQSWLADNGMDPISADEIPFDAPLSDEQKEVVRTFSALWMALHDAEHVRVSR